MAIIMTILATLKYYYVCTEYIWHHQESRHSGRPTRKAHAGHGIAGCMIDCIELEAIKSSSLSHSIHTVHYYCYTTPTATISSATTITATTTTTQLQLQNVCPPSPYHPHLRHPPSSTSNPYLPLRRQILSRLGRRATFCPSSSRELP